MNIHLDAQPGDISDKVIISGDPLRIKYMAETFLNDLECFNKTRGMLGFTGTYKGRQVSMMSTGIGIPSAALYVHELIHQYQVKTIIRAGTVGALLPELELGHLLIAMSASTDSSFNKITFNGKDFSPTADFGLLEQAVSICRNRNIPFMVGQVLSTDRFYNEDEDWLRPWIQYGVLGAEMETAAVYTLAARNRVRALSILSVTDNLVKGVAAPASVRERKQQDMFEVALQIQ